MRKTNRIKDIPICGQNVFCVRQYLRTLGQVKKAAWSVTHPAQSFSSVLESIFCISSALVERFSPGIHTSWGDALRSSLGLAGRFKQLHSRDWHGAWGSLLSSVLLMSFFVSMKHSAAQLQVAGIDLPL